MKAKDFAHALRRDQGPDRRAVERDLLTLREEKLVEGLRTAQALGINTRDPDERYTTFEFAEALANRDGALARFVEGVRDGWEKQATRAGVRQFTEQLAGRRPIPTRKDNQAFARGVLEHARRVVGKRPPLTEDRRLRLAAMEADLALLVEAALRSEPRRNLREAVAGNQDSVQRDLAECWEQDGVAVDETGSVLKDVVFLSGESKNRRRYLPETMDAALPLYENLMVNIDHPTANPNQPRSVRDRFGKLVNCRIEAGKGRADLKYNPHHADAPAIAWYARNMPECLGLSHNSIGEGYDKDGVFVVTRIVRVRSCDLVADPATTAGLFEASLYQ